MIFSMTFQFRISCRINKTCIETDTELYPFGYENHRLWVRGPKNRGWRETLESQQWIPTIQLQCGIDLSFHTETFGWVLKKQREGEDCLTTERLLVLGDEKSSLKHSSYYAWVLTTLRLQKGHLILARLLVDWPPPVVRSDPQCQKTMRLFLPEEPPHEHAEEYQGYHHNWHAYSQ